jgi:hypothetical protein
VIENIGSSCAESEEVFHSSKRGERLMLPEPDFSFDKAVPDVLYHYTSLDAMVNIVRTQRLWASNVRFLNDSTENKYLLDGLRRRVAGLINEAENDDRREKLHRLGELLASPSGNNDYVTSFSQQSDDLSQWRGYATPGRGVAMGFSGEGLRNLAYGRVIDDGDSRPDAYWYRGQRALHSVIYVDLEITPSVDFGIDLLFSEQVTKIPDLDFVQLFHNGRVSIAPFYKHASFKHEDEWRFIVRNHPGSTRNLLQIKFRPGVSTLIPYIEISLTKHFLKTIVIGPSPNIELSTEAVQQFLAAEGLSNVSVVRSAVPYRHW